MREEESMKKELNEKIFNKDPIVRIVDPNYGQADYINKININFDIKYCFYNSLKFTSLNR